MASVFPQGLSQILAGRPQLALLLKQCPIWVTSVLLEDEHPLQYSAPFPTLHYQHSWLSQRMVPPTGKYYYSVSPCLNLSHPDVLYLKRVYTESMYV